MLKLIYRNTIYFPAILAIAFSSYMSASGMSYIFGYTSPIWYLIAFLFVCSLHYIADRLIGYLMDRKYVYTASYFLYFAAVIGIAFFFEYTGIQDTKAQRSTLREPAIIGKLKADIDTLQGMQVELIKVDGKAISGAGFLMDKRLEKNKGSKEELAAMIAGKEALLRMHSKDYSNALSRLQQDEERKANNTLIATISVGLITLFSALCGQIAKRTNSPITTAEERHIEAPTEEPREVPVAIEAPTLPEDLQQELEAYKQDFSARLNRIKMRAEHPVKDSTPAVIIAYDKDNANDRKRCKCCQKEIENRTNKQFCSANCRAKFSYDSRKRDKNA